jgi:hypothetical protein
MESRLSEYRKKYPPQSMLKVKGETGFPCLSTRFFEALIGLVFEGKLFETDMKLNSRPSKQPTIEA